MWPTLPPRRSHYREVPRRCPCSHIVELLTDNGPDLHVYVTDNAEDEAAGYFVNLGTLKGNQGTQNYDVPLDDVLPHALSVR